MAQNEKNLRDVYNTLKKEGYTPPEFELFMKDMEDEENLRDVYNTLKREGYTPPEFETFRTDMNGAAAVEPVKAATPVADVLENAQPQALAGGLVGSGQPKESAAAGASQENAAAVGYKPSAEEMLALHEMGRSRDAMFGERLGQMQRMAEANTAEGRQRAQAMERQASMSGLDTRLMGLTAGGVRGGVEGGEVAEGAGGADEDKMRLPTEGPKVWGVKDVNGEKKIEWLMPDGTLTTDIMEADRGEFMARKGRLQQAFLGRMRDNGLDPSKQSDIKAQSQLDFEAPIRDAVAKAMPSGEGSMSYERMGEIADEVYEQLGSSYKKQLEEGYARYYEENPEYLPEGETAESMGEKLARESVLRNVLNHNFMGPVKAAVDDVMANEDAKEREYLEKMTASPWKNMGGVAGAIGRAGAKKADGYRDIGRMMDEVWTRLPEEYRDALVHSQTAYYTEHPKEVEDGETITSMGLKMAKAFVGQEIYEWFVEQNMPKGKSEFFVRKLVGENPATAILSSTMTPAGDAMANIDAMGRYGKEHKVLDLAGTVASFMIDPSVYVGGWAAGPVSKWALGRLGQSALFGLSKEVAARGVMGTFKGALVKGATAGATNFMVFETMHDVQGQMQMQGFDVTTGREGGYSVMQTLGAAGRGALLGAATGTIMPVLGNYVDPLVKASKTTTGKLMLRGGQQAVAIPTEATIFSLPEWISGEEDNWDVWTDNLAMIIGFRVAPGHLYRTATEVVRGLRPIKPTGGRELSVEEKAHNMKSMRERLDSWLERSEADEWLSDEEIDELAERGYPLWQVMHDVKKRGTSRKTQGQEGDGTSLVRQDLVYGEEVVGNRLEGIDGYEDFERMLGDPNVPQMTKAKLYKIITGRNLALGTIVGYREVEGAGGAKWVQTMTASGEVVTSRKVRNERERQTEVDRANRQMELNAIVVGEMRKEAERNYTLVEKTVSELYPEHANVVLDAYRRSKNGEKFEGAAADMIDAIDVELARKMATDFEDMPENIRERIKAETGHDPYDVREKRRSERTKSEQDALTRYIEELYSTKAGREAESGMEAEYESAREEFSSGADSPDDEGPDGPQTGDGGGGRMASTDEGVTGASEAMRRLEDARNGLEDTFGDDFGEMVWGLDTYGLEYVKDNLYGMMPMQREAVLEYLNAKSAVAGMHAGAQEGFEARREAVVRKVEGMKHLEDGVVMRATMVQDGREVYVLSGHLEKYPDGSAIDTGASREWLVVMDAESGDKRVITPSMLEDFTTEGVTEALEREMAGVEGVLDWQAGYDEAYSVRGSISDESLVARYAALAEKRDAEGLTYREMGELEALYGEWVRRERERERERAAEAARGEGEHLATNLLQEGEAHPETNGDEGHLATNLSQGDEERAPETNLSLEGEERAPETNASLGSEGLPEANGGEGDVVEGRQEGTALSRIPIDEETQEPMFEKVDSETAWDGLVEEAGNDKAAAAVAQAQIGQARAELEALEKKRPTMKEPKLKGSAMAMIRAQREAEDKYREELDAYNRQVADVQERVDAWEGILGVYNSRNGEARRNAEEARRVREAKEHDEAVARFEEQQRIKAEREAEQAAIGAHAVNPKIKEKWDSSPKFEGHSDIITLPDGSQLRGKYVLYEAGVASASHDPNNGFAPTEGFPIDANGQSVNDRDYQRDKDAQRIVEDMAGSYDSRALQNPVVVSQDGIVLSGNNRTMSGDLAARQGTDKAYIDYLKEFGSKYGLTLEQIEGMEHPRVAFVPDEPLPYDATTFSRFNAQEMKSQSKPEAAVKLGKIVPENVFNSIVNDISRHDRMGDYYGDEKAVAFALGSLMHAGVINDKQLPELRTGTALSPAGKELIENTLIGKVFQSNPDGVRQLISMPSVRQAVVMALSEIASNRALASAGYDLSSELAKAIDLVYRAKATAPDIYTEGKPISPFGRMQGLFDDEFGDSRVTDATTLLLADILNSGKPSDLRKVLATYNKDARRAAAGQMDIFSGEPHSKEDILTSVNNLFKNATSKEQQAIIDAAIADRKDRAGQESEQTPTVGESDTEGTERTTGNAGGDGERSDNLEEEQSQLDYKLSNEIDENGRQFVLTSSGEIEFGRIEGVNELADAPILLSEGVITNPKTKKGYGLVHIEARHGDEIRGLGFNSVIDFIEEVAKNYDVIREGKERDGQQTYLLQLQDKHNNTLIVELAGDGTYWNINTAGVFKTSYGRKGKEVYNRHTTEKQPAETAEASQDVQQSGTDTTSSMNAPTLPADKGSEKVLDEQIKGAAGDKPAEEVVRGIDEALGLVRETHDRRFSFDSDKTLEELYEEHREAVERADQEFDKLSDEELISLIESDKKLAREFEFGTGAMSVSRTRDRIVEIRSSREYVERYEQASELPMAKGGAKAKKAKMTDYVGDDQRRPALTGVYHDKDRKMAVATDTRVMVVDKREYDESRGGEIVNKKGEKVNGEYPAYSRAIPSTEPKIAVEIGKEMINSAAVRLREALKGVKKSDVGSVLVAVKLSEGKVVLMGAREAAMLLEGVLKIGGNTIEYRGANKALVSRSENGVVLAMPYNAEGGEIGYRIDLSERPGGGASEGRVSEQRVSGRPDGAATSRETEARDALVGLMRGAGIEVSTDWEEGQRVLDAATGGVREQTGAPMYFRTSEGEVYGFTLDGKIYIDPRIATSETPVHEYHHLWAEALEKDNPEAWAHLKEQLFKDKELAEWVKEMYPDLEDENDIAHELFAQFGGKRGAERLKREQSLMEAKNTDGTNGRARIARMFERLRGLLKKYWQMSRDLFAGNNARLKSMSAEDFADMAMSDLLHGIKPGEDAKKRAADRHKAEQFDIVTRANRMEDDYHTGVRSIDDIKTYKEAVDEAIKEGEGLDTFPDYTVEDAKRAIESGEITVYSSKPIENGVFVTPSRKNAEDYAGEGRVYEKRVSVEDVAWVYADEGQYAKTDPGTVRFDFAKDREEFERTRERAIAEKGIVMPGLAEKEVVVTNVPRHDFSGTGKDALQKAEKWAQSNLVGEHVLTDASGRHITYEISERVIGKYVSDSATRKSVNIGVHLAVLKQLPEVIQNSIEAEIHPDYPRAKGGERDASLEPGKDIILHRFYGAVEIAGEIYRVKTTIKEHNRKGVNPYSYEVEKIELLDSEESSNLVASMEQLPKGASKEHANLGNNSEVRKISGEELLRGVEKSYDSGKTLLEESGKVRMQRSPGMEHRAERGDFVQESRGRYGRKKSRTHAGASLFDFDGEGETTAFDVLNEAMNTIMNNFNPADYKDYTASPSRSEHKMARSGGKRRGRSTAGRNLFGASEAPSLFGEEEIHRNNERKPEPEVRKLDERASAANGAIEAFGEAYKSHAEGQRELRERLGREDLSEAERAELEAIFEQQDEELALERERLRESLREYYAEGNTPEDAERMSREMAARAEAELSIRIDGEKLLRSMLSEPDFELSEEESEGSGEQKTAGGLIRYTAKGHLPDAKKGEFAYVERMFTLSGEFSFTSGGKVKDRGDVAYIFRALQDYSVEQVFAVYVKGGEVKVLHLSMGGPTMSLVDMSAVIAGEEAFGAEKIYFVHNHPSGSLTPSPQDQNVIRNFISAFGEEKVEGLIIDTTSGEYSSYGGNIGFERERIPSSRSEDESVDVYRFDRKAESASQELRKRLSGASAVADYLGQLRGGKGQRSGYLVLSNAGEVVANYITEGGLKDMERLSEEMVSVGTKHMGRSLIVYGDVDMDKVGKLNRLVKGKSAETLRLVDAISIDENGYVSANEHGRMSEPKATYGKEADKAGESSVGEMLGEGETGGEDRRYRTSSEIDAQYPNWLEGTTTESGKHSTQVEGTRKTYSKVGDWIESNLGKGVTILDASSGMGYGTRDLRERGFDIEDVEPYQSEQRKAENPATYDSYEAVEKQYDYIISNAVLNVIPDDWRRNVLHDMASRLNPGGKLFINTRKAGEEKAIKDKIELDTPQEVLVKRNGKIASYQRFFTPAELKQWVESELGEGYTVEIANERNSGTKGLAAVVVTRDKAELARESRNPKDMEARVVELSEKMHTPVRIVKDLDSPGDKPLSARDRQAKGWFDPVTGEVVVVLPNNKDVADVENTVVHEVVGHEGLRALVGEERMGNFMDEIYGHASDEIKQKIDAMAERMAEERGVEADGMRREATEEYLADMAGRIGDEGFEKMSREEQTLWGQIKARVQRFLDSFLRGLGISKSIRLTDKDLAYILFKSWKNKRNGADGGGRQKTDIFAQAEDAVMRRRTGWDASAEKRYRDPDMGLEEAVTSIKAETMAKNEEDLEARRDAMRAIGGNLNKLRQAMARQRDYDISTVKSVSDMARVFMDNGLLDDLTRGEIKKLLGMIDRVVGKESVKTETDKLIDMMIGNHLERSERDFNSMLRIRGSRVDAKGVEVQGVLDVEGQTIVGTVKEAKGYSTADIDEMLGDAQERMASSSQTISDEAAARYMGLLIAREYAESVTQSKADERAMRESIKEAKAEKDAGRMSAEDYKQFVEATEESIRQNRIERAEAFERLIELMAGTVGSSIERAKAWRESEKKRVGEIHHMANSDMEGRPATEHRKEKWWQKLNNFGGLRFLLMPLSTFDQMLRSFGNKHAKGEGYLWSHFMRRWVESAEMEYEGYRDSLDTLNKKVAEIFGKNKRWSDLYALDRKLPKAEVDFWDGGEVRSHLLTQGNLMYIYMVDKMPDGRVKLRRMGIGENEIEAIKGVLDARFMELADWLQEEFLVEKRNKYNAVHKRMFGASMAAIENYFPLKILGDARVQEEDVANYQSDAPLPGTITGAIKKRRFNKTALDVTGANALSVTLDHLQEMEHWAAYAEFNRDLGTLLSYKRFRNKVKNMNTMYGSGDELWGEFKRVCAIAAGSYKPPVAKADKYAVNFAKGVSSAKVSGRVFTALKQFASMGAYLSESNPIYLAKSLVTPGDAWRWAMKNLPIFEKRWKSRTAGDPRLLKTEMDFGMWRSQLVQMASRVGMSPNAFVDALTVSIGAKAMYDTKLAKYKRWGMSIDEAKKRARQDATILFNQSQQSSERAFLSPLQVNRSWMSVMWTLFRNASMSYTRQALDAVRNISRYALKPGYRKLSIAFMEKQLGRDGVESAKASKAARQELHRGLVRDFVRVGVYAYLMQYVWNMFAYLPYLIAGDDDEKKEEFMDDASKHALYGATEGLVGGDLISARLNGETNPKILDKEMPATADIQKILDEWDKDEAVVLNDVINLLVQSGLGFNPETLTNAAAAIMDAGGGTDTSREIALCVMRVMNCPDNQLDKVYFDELAIDGKGAKRLSVEEIAERYARYKSLQGAFLTGWARGEEGEQEIREKYRKRVQKEAKGHLDRWVGREGVRELLDEYAAEQEEEKAAKKLWEEDREAGRAERDAMKTRWDMRRIRRIGRFKADMNELTKMYLQAKDGEESARVLELVEGCRRKFLEDVNEGKE